MRKASIALLALLLTASAAATSISEEEVVVDLDTLEVEHDVNFSDLTSSRMTYIVNHPVEDLYVEIEGEEADCEFEELGIGGEISCATDQEEDFNTFIRYRTSDLISFDNGEQTFRYSQNIYRPKDSYTLRAVLPEGGGLLDNENTTAIEPEHGEIGSEGRRIHVEWSQDPDLGETLSFRVSYEELDRGLTEIIGVLLLAGLIIGIAYYLRSERTEKEPELPEDQQRVLGYIEENGSMLQKDLVDEMEYSKAKVSGLVSELEEQELIQKEKEGRSNRLYLED